MRQVQISVHFIQITESVTSHYSNHHFNHDLNESIKSLSRIRRTKRWKSILKSRKSIMIMNEISIKLLFSKHICKISLMCTLKKLLRRINLKLNRNQISIRKMTLWMQTLWFLQSNLQLLKSVNTVIKALNQKISFIVILKSVQPFDQ